MLNHPNPLDNACNLCGLDIHAHGDDYNAPCPTVISDEFDVVDVDDAVHDAHETGVSIEVSADGPNGPVATLTGRADLIRQLLDSWGYQELDITCRR